MERTEHAKALFEPLGATYDRNARRLSLWQDPRWRRVLVSVVEVGPGDRVLDVATGTGAVALELVRQKGCDVVGVDQSPGMLLEADRRAGRHVELVEASADALPFADASFDAVTFTYLLRYVDDPAATLRELARVVRPGGTVAGLEFAVPRGLWRPLWELYVRAGLPLACRLAGPGWREVGSFLGDSIREFERAWPVPRLLDAWWGAGLEEVRMRRLSLGGAVVTWARKTVPPPEPEPE